MAIDNNVLKGKWKQFKGDIKRMWGQITDDELDQIGGDRMKLEGKLQEKYGYSKEKAREEVDRWMGTH